MRITSRAVVLLIMFAVLVTSSVHAREFFVRFHDTEDKQANELWLQERGIRIIETYKLTDAVLCETMDKSDPPLESLAADPAIKYATPNVVFKAVDVPEDPFFDMQWSLRNTGQIGGTPGADISAVEAWEHVSGADEVLVGIIDTGVDYTHPDLVNRMWDGGPEYPNHGVDVANGDNDPMPDNYHGTHVAGIVAAEIGNLVGIAGIAPNVKIMAVKAAPDGTGEFPLNVQLLAMDFCFDHGVDVVNASYGGLYVYSDALRPLLESMEDLYAAGVVFVGAAGNDGVDLDSVAEDFYPACFDVPNVISVGGTDNHDELWIQSNYGRETIDLGAPGRDILSTHSNHSYLSMSGTSMAAPHVTGAVAILLGLYPDLSPEEVRSAVMDGAIPLPDLSRTVISGGRLDLMGMLSAADPIPPADVTDLVVRSELGNSIYLKWTAVGDDGYVGTAHCYDLRYALSPILDEADFAAATRVSGVSSPRESGLYEIAQVVGLDPSTTYYFALRVGDRAGNWSQSALADGTTDVVSVAVVDETPRDYALMTGESELDAIQIQNVGDGSLQYLTRAVSIGRGSASRGLDGPIIVPSPYSLEARPRETGRNKRGPEGTSGFAELGIARADGTAEWGTLFHDDFETGIAAWTTTVLAGSDLWHQSDTAYNSPYHSLAFTDQINGTYETGEELDVAIASGTVSLIGAEGDIILEFFEWYGTEFGYDFCDVEVSENGGVDWETVRGGVSGDSGGWRLTTVDLSAYRDETINIRFRFHTGDGEYNDHPGWYIDDVIVRDEGTSWLSFVYGSGNVSAGGSRYIHYLVDALGLCAGDYNAEVQIHTNDPAHPLFIVPIDLAVTSAPDLHYESQGLDMGTVYVGATGYRSFQMSNIGCLPLQISNLSCSSASFTATLTTTTITPGTAADLNVSFSPSAASNSFAVITFSTNEPGQPMVTLYAFGTGLEAPQIALSETVYVEQVSGMSIWGHSLAIQNDGLGTLDWQRAYGLDAGGNPRTAKSVLFGNDTYHHHQMFEERVAAAGFGTASIDEIDPVDMEFTPEILADFDVVVIYGYDKSYSAAEIAALATWLADGGGLLFDHHVTQTPQSMADLLLGLGTGVTYGEDGDARKVDMAPLFEHQLTQNVALVYGGYNHDLDTVAPPMMPFVESAAGDVVMAMGTVGKGRVCLSMLRFTRDSNLARADNLDLVDNVLAWLTAGPLSFEPAAGTVAPGGVQNVDIVYDTTDVLEGTYDHDCLVTSNDPAMPVVTIAATYVVADGTGHLQSPRYSYDMGLVYAAADTNDLDITLLNTGNGAITMQDISSSNPRFTVQPDNNVLQARERGSLSVHLQPGGDGIETTEIVITTDEPSQPEVVFTVEASPQLPYAAFSTNVLSMELENGESGSQDFELINTGGWPLTYEFIQEQGTGIRIDATEVTGEVAPYSSRSMTVCYLAPDECDVPPSTAIFTMDSNDPTFSDEITATMVVVNAPPHIDVTGDTRIECQAGFFGVDGHLYLWNGGCDDLVVDDITIAGDSCFTLNVPFFTGLIAPGDAGSFTYEFRPPEVGQYSTTISVMWNDGSNSHVREIIVNGEGIGVGGKTSEPVDTALRNMPNPFNPSTTISFYIPDEGRADVCVYNLQGQLVRQLDVGSVSAGRGQVEWNGRDRHGRPVTSGVYFYRVRLDGRPIGETGRAVLLK